MDGVFVAYHNTNEIFGFQYLSLETIDEIIYGNSATASAAFALSVNSFQYILDFILGSIKEKDQDALRFIFKLSKDASQLAIFVENNSESHDVLQFKVTASSTINGLKSNTIILDPNNADDEWSVSLSIAKVDTNFNEYQYAKNYVSGADLCQDLVPEYSSKVKDRRISFSQMIMRNVQKSDKHVSPWVN